MKKSECRSRTATETASTERFAREIVTFAEGARAAPDTAEGAQVPALTTLTNAIRSSREEEGPAFPHVS